MKARLLIYSTGVFCLLMILLPFFAFGVESSSGVNLILYASSSVFVSFAIYSLFNSGPKSYNIFSLTYFGALLSNCYFFSGLQSQRDPEDLFFFLAGALVLVCIFYFADLIKVKRFCARRLLSINVNYYYLIILALYVSIFSYYGWVYGFRLSRSIDMHQLVSGSAGQINSGLFGYIKTLQWSLLMYSLYVKRRYAFLAIIAILFFSVILSVKRGDMVRIALFYMIYYCHINLKQGGRQVRSLVIKLTISLVLIALAISIYGSYRMSIGGSGENEIVNLLGSKVNSPTLSWVYSYFSFNFSVLKLYYPQHLPPHYPSFLYALLFDPVVNTVSPSIHGFNAGTFLGNPIANWGYMYLIPVIVIGLYIALLIAFVKFIDFMPGYIFILMLVSLLVFGNYFQDRVMLVAIVFSGFSYFFINKRSLRKGKKPQGL